MTNNNTASNNNAVAVFGKKVGMGDWVEFFVPTSMGVGALARLVLSMKVSEYKKEAHGWAVTGSLPEVGEWVWVPRCGDIDCCGEERRYKVTL